MKRQTQAIHTKYARRDAYDALSMPVYNAVAFEFDDAKVMADAFTNRIDAPDYSRVENPTVTYLEQKVKTLTGAANVTALNSGMAAISNTLMALSGAGKNIVTSRHLFGNTLGLLTNTLGRFGVEARLCDLTNLDEVSNNIDENTCCIPFTETRLHALGVDIEVVSSTKYLSGGATSLGGLIIDYGTTAGFNDRVKFELLFNLGAYMTPQVAYMQTLGLETLNARYRVQATNALQLATRLQTLSGQLTVNYVGLEDNPYHQLAVRQFGPTAGAMMTIDLPSQEACFEFINRLRLIRRATNLFDNKTLAIHPASTIFGNFNESELQAMDVKTTTIRLSIGLEDVDDLFDDIRQALE